LQIPLELAFNGLPKDESIVALINQRVEKIEKICDHIVSCRIIIDRPQETSNPYRVTLLIRVPHENEIVAKRDSAHGDTQDSLPVVIREVFDAAHKQLKQLVERQRGHVKSHPEQELAAVVSKLFAESGYGFIRTINGREVYFHKNSVLHDDFDRLRIGTGVRFEEEPGNEGPQATTVEIVDQPSA
jgi:cold shock CspA family protein